jgi:sulfur-oxidizing protein SoxZ
MSVRARLTLPPQLRAGEDFEVRLLLQHPMETGQRVDAEGRRLPRDIVQEVEALLDGQRVWRARLHPAVAANPYLAFWLRIERPGVLEILWRGDGGFEHRQRAELRL